MLAPPPLRMARESSPWFPCLSYSLDISYLSFYRLLKRIEIKLAFIESLQPLMKQVLM